MTEPALVLGTMSGTSCDGLDLALCAVGPAPENLELLAFTSVPYSADWRSRLRSLGQADAQEAASIEQDWTLWVADVIKGTRRDWEKIHGVPALVGFSGHTWYHEPGGRGTRAMGDAAWLAQTLGVPVVADYRSADVEAGGQGAPLVPLFDAHVFSGYACCVNLGGILNLTLLPPAADAVRAWDVAGCNLLLNRQAMRAGSAFDRNGQMSARGQVSTEARAQLDGWAFLAQKGPKSLSAEDLAPLHDILDAVPLPEDALATAVDWIASTFASALEGHDPGKVLLTGGGAFNAHLVEQMAAHLPDAWEHTVPDVMWVDGKEAAAFAWLAWRTAHGQTTSLASVTGAHSDICGGRVFGNFAAS